jgi:predicted nucleic acid-binding protein
VNSIIVLDCNAAIEMALERPKADKLYKIISVSDIVYSSNYMKIECANVLQKYYRGELVSLEEAQFALEKATSLVDKYFPLDYDYADAFKESIRLKHSAYDMLYLVLAKRYNALLLTLDGPLNELARGEDVETVEL